MVFSWRRIDKDVFNILNFSIPSMHYFFLFFHSFYSQTAIFLFFIIFFSILKVSFGRVYELFNKLFRHIMSYNIRVRKSNVFVNIVKASKIILSRSLGTLGFKKKKKKMYAHPAYLMGKKLTAEFKERLVKPVFKKIFITIKGFKRFFKAGLSNQFYFTKGTRYKHTGQVRKQKKWLLQKCNFLSRIRVSGRGNRKFIPHKIRKYIQRKLKFENKIKKEVQRLRNVLIRPIFIQSLTSVPFGGVKPKGTNLFKYYTYRNIL